MVKKLESVRLSNTTITGDVAALGTWPRIEEVDLSDTEVTGTFHVNSVLEDLHILKLTGTRTKIDFTGMADSDCPFRAMTTLEVSGLAMDASVSRILSSVDPLSAFEQHRGLQVVASPGSFRRLLCFMTKGCPFDETNLGRVLGFLNLASNRIDQSGFDPGKVESLGAGRGNTNMSFADGVLQKAVQDGILLDMQNVTFTNQTDAHRCMA